MDRRDFASDVVVARLRISFGHDFAHMREHACLHATPARDRDFAGLIHAEVSRRSIYFDVRCDRGNNRRMRPSAVFVRTRRAVFVCLRRIDQVTDRVTIVIRYRLYLLSPVVEILLFLSSYLLHLISWFPFVYYSWLCSDYTNICYTLCFFFFSFNTEFSFCLQFISVRLPLYNLIFFFVLSLFFLGGRGCSFN